MEKENIKSIGIAHFKESQFVLDYVDNDFVVVSGLEGNPYSDDTVRLECFLIAICVEGCIQLDVNYKTYQIEAGSLLFGLPNTIISRMLVSPRYKIRLAAFSPQFLHRVIRVEKDTWNIAAHLQSNPIKLVGKEENQDYFKDLIIAKINDEPHRYQKEVMQYLFSALFCEILGYLSKEMPLTGTADEGKGDAIRQSDHILRRFVEMLSKDNGMHRSVGYYADALCYSPKHLSKVIKQACGRTPLELINENAIEHIKYRLKHSDKSIKEIAEEFDFPNQSFFGKYVKSHLGMSPARYRNSKEEN